MTKPARCTDPRRAQRGDALLEALVGILLLALLGLGLSHAAALRCASAWASMRAAVVARTIRWNSIKVASTRTMEMTRPVIRLMRVMPRWRSGAGGGKGMARDFIGSAPGCPGQAGRAPSCFRHRGWTASCA